MTVPRVVPAPGTRLPDIESLRLLALIADTRSIGSAARQLGISQPSASKRVKQLEHRLGIALLERGSHGSVLTEHGRAITDWARTVLSSVQTLLVGAQALRADTTAGVSTASSQTVAEYLLPHWLAALHARAPHVSVRLRVTNSTGVFELVRAHEVQLGFVESPGVPRDLSSRVMATDRLVVVVAPGHSWARRRSPVSAGDLLAADLVLREAGSGTRATLERALGTIPTRHLELDSNAAVKVIVAAGNGAAVLSTLAVAGELADRRLVEVPTQGLDLRRSLRAIWPRGRRLVGAAAEFLGVIQGG